MGYGPSPCPECNAAFMKQLERTKKGKEAKREQSKVDALVPYFNRGKPE